MTSEIKEALDLGRWDEFAGYGSVHGLLCPGCGNLSRSPTESERGGYEKCRYCHQLCRWIAVASGPLGPFWQTWRLVRRGATEGE